MVVQSPDMVGEAASCPEHRHGGRLLQSMDGRPAALDFCGCGLNGCIAC